MPGLPTLAAHWVHTPALMGQTLQMSWVQGTEGVLQAGRRRGGARQEGGRGGDEQRAGRCGQTTLHAIFLSQALLRPAQFAACWLAAQTLGCAAERFHAPALRGGRSAALRPLLLKPSTAARQARRALLLT